MPIKAESFWGDLPPLASPAPWSEQGCWTAAWDRGDGGARQKGLLSPGSSPLRAPEGQSLNISASGVPGGASGAPAPPELHPWGVLRPLPWQVGGLGQACPGGSADPWRGGAVRPRGSGSTGRGFCSQTSPGSRRACRHLNTWARLQWSCSAIETERLVESSEAQGTLCNWWRAYQFKVYKKRKCFALSTFPFFLSSFSVRIYIEHVSCSVVSESFATVLSMGFSRQEYWSGLPFPSPGDLPYPGIIPVSPALQAESFTIWACVCVCV